MTRRKAYRGKRTISLLLLFFLFLPFYGKDSYGLCLDGEETHIIPMPQMALLSCHLAPLPESLPPRPSFADTSCGEHGEGHCLDLSFTLDNSIVQRYRPEPLPTRQLAIHCGLPALQYSARTFLAWPHTDQRAVTPLLPSRPLTELQTVVLII